MLSLAGWEFTYPGWTVLPPEAQPAPEIAIPYTALLVDTGTARILVDTGAGSLGPSTGKLTGSLATLGLGPKDVGCVILTHAHPDHIAGLHHFPHAEIVIIGTEFAFWTAPETENNLRAGQLYGLGPLEQLMADYVRDHLKPAKDRLRLIEEPTEVAPGVLVFAAGGHTPGHAAVLVSSGRQQLLFAGDAVIHPAQFNNPEWVSVFDLAPDQTVETRRKLLDRAVADRCVFAAFHLPGAVGAAERVRGLYHWEPLKGTDA